MPYKKTSLSRYYRFLDRQGRTFNAVLGLGFCLVLGALDLLTPEEYSFSFVYIVPISITTWFAGRRAGYLASLICSAILARYHIHESLSAAVWNNLSTLGLFCVVTYMLFRIRQLLENESTLARTDPLTGAMNLRSITELVEYETLRLQRDFSPFSIAYFGRA